jgi:hypothetical protein
MMQTIAKSKEGKGVFDWLPIREALIEEIHYLDL